MSSSNTEGPRPSAPAYPWTVTKFNLRLSRLMLERLSLDEVNRGAPPPELATLEMRGRLLEQHERGFSCSLEWVLQFPGAGPWPAALCGKHRLEFAHEPGLPEKGAIYYAMVNSIILAYPYVRELVSDITCRVLGQAVIVAPLDVPKFVIERDKEFRQSIRRGDGQEPAPNNGADIRQHTTQGAD